MRTMDILRFINSKDIRKHLKDIDYKFSSLEAAWLVYQCHDATIDEKHKAWNEIIETMPDCSIKKRRRTIAQDSLHEFLKRYMEIEDKLIEEFCDEKHDDTFSFDKPFVYKFEYIYKNGSKYDWGTVFSCYEAIFETIMEPDEDVDLIMCIKMRIDRLSRLPQVAFITPKLEFLKFDPGTLDYDEESEITKEDYRIYLGVFGGLWFDFPTPFKKGDIVWKPSIAHKYSEGPFVIGDNCIDRIKNENVKDFLKADGDNTDMNVVGYFVDENGIISSDNIENYMDIEFYDKELSGAEVLLKTVSDLLNGKTEKDLLEHSCWSVAAGHIRDSLKLSGLSPEPEHVKIWLDDIREAPEGYFHCKSVNEAIKTITKCEQEKSVIDVIDCDHDLGDYASDGGDGIKIIDWLAERKSFYPIKLHTMNPVGCENMQREIDRYWKNRYGKIDKSELIPLNSWDDSCAKVTLDDYDWMHYTAEFVFRTERCGKMNIRFEYTGFKDCLMTVTNNGISTVYKFDHKLFEKWIVKYLTKHMEQWEGVKAFRGEDLMLEFYNDVIEQGVLEENGEQGV